MGSLLLRLLERCCGDPQAIPRPPHSVCLSPKHGYILRGALSRIPDSW